MMVDHTKTVVEKLNSILPTVYEFFLDSQTPVPCITYVQTMNSDLANGNDLGWSSVQYRVKVWAKTVDELTNYTQQIDAAMATLGRFKRVSCTDLVYGDTLCRVVDYNITVTEIYNTQRYK